MGAVSFVARVKHTGGYGSAIIDVVKIRPQLQQSDCGWLALLAGIVAYELYADDDQLLSHGAARYRQARPVLTTTIVLVTAAHLLEAIPERVDPFHVAFRMMRRRRR